MGNTKAAVFPVPLWATPKTSFRFRAMGMAFSCMSVGLV